MAEEFRVLRPQEYHSQLVIKGSRADGRSLEDFRPIKLETDAIRTADASSLVKLGNTSLVCGCTAQLVKNEDCNEDDEPLKIKIELPPICSSPYGNRTQINAQLLTRTVKNILEDTRCIDNQQFYDDKSESHWSIDVEVICLNYDGCILDAALIAVLSALKSLRLHDDLVQLTTIPVTSSFALIGERIICDPNLEEESVAQSTFSITADSTTKKNFHISKIGGKSLSSGGLLKCIGLASGRAEQVGPVIKSVTSDKKMEI